MHYDETNITWDYYAQYCMQGSYICILPRSVLLYLANVKFCNIHGASIYVN